MEKEKLIKYIEKCYEDAKEYGYVIPCRNQAFGALDFYIEINGEDTELSLWWNNEMLEKFNDLGVDR